MGVFNSLTLLLVLAYAGILSQGCGRVFENPEEPEIVETPTISLDPPVVYELYDADCQKRKDTHNLERAYIHGWEGLGITDTLKTFDETLTTKVSLESGIISQTHYDRHFQRTCDGGSEDNLNCYGPSGQIQTYTQKNDDNFLRVCRDEFTYPRETFESVALTSTYYLNQAADFYESVYRKSLPKIRLDVLPRFETRVNKFVGGDGVERDISSWLTNNLAYFPKNDLIAVFPENEEKAKASKDHFWESAFVLSHELGHHIEKQFVGEDFKEIGLQWDGSEHRFKALVGIVNNSRSSVLSRMYDSISEGYADLKAFYAVNEDTSTVVNIACMGKNRDVSNGLFADEYTAKRLSVAVAEKMLGEKHSSKMCGEVNYSDSHIVGAVIAYAMNQILNEMVLSQRLDSKTTVSDKYRLIDEWYKALVAAEKAQKSRQLTADKIFQPFAAAIERTVDVYKSMLIARGIHDAQFETAKVRVCQRSQILMPAIKPAPFANALGECGS